MEIPFGLSGSLIEFDEYITPDGLTYRFNTGVDKFMIAGVNGQGMPRVTYREQRGAFQDGSTPLGFVLEPRLVTLLHRRNACNRQGYWDNRADLMNFLRPNRQSATAFETGILRKIEPDGTERDLNVLIDSGPEFAGKRQGRWDEFGIQELIRFIAHDPIFFDPTMNTETFTLAISNELVFSITFSIIFGTNTINETITVAYLGTYKAFPTFTILGPLESLTINNLTTGEKIQLVTNIVAGVVVTISLDFGNKTITDSLGTNLIGSLSTDSDLVSFHLAAAPEATSGENDIQVIGSGATAATAISFTYLTRYIGI